MIERALDAGLPCSWVTGDAVYGGDRRLRVWLESRDQAFVLAVAKDEPPWWQGPTYVRANVRRSEIEFGALRKVYEALGRRQSTG